MENHGIEKAAQKTEEVNKLMKETLKTLENHKGSIVFSLHKNHKKELLLANIVSNVFLTI